MKRSVYKALLEFLKLLVLAKRTLAHVLVYAKRGFWKLDEVVRNTIGYRLYTWQKRIHKYQRLTDRLHDGRLIEFFGQRSLLQLVLIIVVLVIVAPQSRLYTQDLSVIPGRQTLLYQIAGPGEQDFSMEEVVTRRTVDLPEGDTQRWTDGAVVRLNTAIEVADVQPVGTTRELASLSPQGAALIKPTIAPGSVIVTPEPNEPLGTERGTVRYIVQPGDVLGGIATEFGVSVETILWANDLNIRSVIQPGDELVILPTSGLIHRVKSGDTLGRIARLYDAEIGDILSENNLSSAATIQIGQELIIPGGTRIAVAPTPRPVQQTTPSTPTVSQPTTPSTPPPPAPASDATYIWPTSVRTITQYYGWRHTGVDIAGPIGSPLYASRAGTVVKSQCGWNGGYGCYIILDHGDGFQTLYGHASELYVSVGETVTQGQTIALMGSTGRSTGPHIHFEVRIGGRHTNPFSYVN